MAKQAAPTGSTSGIPHEIVSSQDSVSEPMKKGRKSYKHGQELKHGNNAFAPACSSRFPHLRRHQCPFLASCIIGGGELFLHSLWYGTQRSWLEEFQNILVPRYRRNSRSSQFAVARDFLYAAVPPQPVRRPVPRRVSNMRRSPFFGDGNIPPLPG